MPKTSETKKTSKKKEEKPKKIEKISQADYEKKILELAGKGLTSEKIGEVLRKQGIHPKEYDKKISQILGKAYINPDLKNIQAKLERVKNHYGTNKQDKRAMREKDRIFAQLKKQKEYHQVS